MMTPHHRCCLLALACLLPTLASAQLVRQANTTLMLPADLPAATGYTTENALGTLTFSNPIDMASPPGVTNRLFVIERNTGIQIVNLDTLTQSPFLALATYLTAQSTPLQTGSECGILSLAFHPNYNQNGYFYVFFSLNVGGVLHQRVARFQATDPDGNPNNPANYNAATTADPATQVPLITQRDSAGNHNGGDLAFGNDGYLYISVGDEGPQYDGGDNARRIAKDFFGAILRIDVDQDPLNLAPNPHDESSTGTVGDSAIGPNTYRVPADNPFVALAQGTGNASYNGYTFPKTAIRTEIWSIGYRNPWRMSFDPPTGRLFVADVGQDNYEEINIVANGANAGWSWREGLHPHTPAVAPTAEPSGFNHTAPIYEYDHTNDTSGPNEPDNDPTIYGTSITGGVVYRGDSLPELLGAYIFADYNSGFIVALRQQGNGSWTGTRLATDSGISGFGIDPRNGDALFCDLTNSRVKRLARTGTTGTAPPATLSATGAFSDLATLTPNAGLVAYDPNVAFWSDYAVKSRWFAIKNLTDTIGFSADGVWTFPTGMVWVKHFDFDLVRGNSTTRRRLETRFLVKTANDVYGLSYRWNNIASGTQTDATLVAEGGLSEVVPGSSPAQTWRYPSRTECRTCHTAVGGFALSFNTRQMNRTHSYGLRTPNQISALGSAGYFTTAPTNVHTLPAFARADDTSQSLEWRVRSYLAVNCVQCHQPGGAAQGNWDARATTATDAANLINALLVNDGNNTAARWVVPGDAPAYGLPTNSMVLKRVRGDSTPPFQRMPPLGTSERNLEAETLLTAWITQDVPTRQNFAQWQTSQFGSPAAPGAGATADPDGDGERNELEFLRRTNPTIPTLPFDPVPTVIGGNLQLSFPQIPNRSLLIETSLNLVDWALWNVPGNTPDVPATNAPRTLVAPIDAPRRFFRARITAP